MIFFIPAGCEIDLTGESNLLLKEGVILRSDRGIDGSEGALIYTNSIAAIPLFKVMGDNVRVSRIRIKGNDTGTNENCRFKSCAYNVDDPKSEPVEVSDGIVISGKKNIEIDHCELWGWTRAAIQVSGYNIYGENESKCTASTSIISKEERSTVHIHHNYIHHNRRTGLGYGVVVYDGYALIEKNVFDYNRHAIAGGGNPNSGYEARYNLVLTNHGGSHSFDMHACGYNDKGGPGGEYISIHHNTFQSTKYPGFRQRHVPEYLCILYNNTFAHERKRDAIKYSNKHEDVSGNFDTRSNIYDKYYKKYFLHDFDGDGITNEQIAVWRF